jgi:hypothetical protein
MGIKSVRALNAFNALVLGVKMLPAYMGEPYEDFLARVHDMPPEDQKKIIKEGALFVQLEKEEIESLVCFTADKNGVPHSAENIKNLGPDQLIEIIVEVCAAIARFKIDFVSDREKKNSRTSR